MCIKITMMQIMMISHKRESLLFMTACLSLSLDLKFIFSSSFALSLALFFVGTNKKGSIYLTSFRLALAIFFRNSSCLISTFSIYCL